MRPSNNFEEFKYTSETIVDNNGKVLAIIDKPYLRIRIGYGHTLTTTPVNCLLDSGSDYNLFPANWGKLINVPIKSGEYMKIYGIGGIVIPSYKHNIHIYIVNSKIDFFSYAYFSEQQNVPLLGRYGFFDKLKKVTFDKEKDSFILSL